TTDHELTLGQIDFLVVVAKRVLHAPTVSWSPSASSRAKLSRSSARGPPRELTLSTTRRAAAASDLRAGSGNEVKLWPTARGGTLPTEAYTDNSHLAHAASPRVTASAAATSATASN